MNDSNSRSTTPGSERESSNFGLPTSDSLEKPPIMGTWRRFYGLVLFVLAADILVFWIVTRVFS